MSFASLTQRLRFTFFGIQGGRPSQPVPSMRPTLECLEDRITPRGGVPETITVESSSPVNIPVDKLKVGQTLILQVVFTTTDPNDQNEGEPLIVAGRTITNYGAQTLRIPVTRNGQTFTAFIKNYDGDESATITVGDRLVNVSVDLAAVASPWLVTLEKLQQTEQAIESILKLTPGWQFYPPKLSKPALTGSISGQLSIAPDGSIDGGQVSVQGSVGADLTALQFWGLPFQVAGIGVSESLGVSFSVGVTAAWDANGSVSFSGSIGASITASLTGSLNLATYRGSLSGSGGVQFTMSVDNSGLASGGATFTGFVVTGKIDYVGPPKTFTVASFSTNLSRSIPLIEWEASVAEIVQGAIHLTLGDPLVVTTQPPDRVAVGKSFGVVVQAEFENGTVNTAFNGLVTIAGFGLRGTTTVTAVNGVASFTGLKLTKAGSYTLFLSAAGMPTIQTNVIEVLARPGKQSWAHDTSWSWPRPLWADDFFALPGHQSK